MKKLTVFLSACGLIALIASPALAGKDDAKIAKAVMALAKKQWAAEMANASMEEIMATVADDYTEFNPTVPLRVDGKDMAIRMTEAIIQDGSTILAAEMLNPKVQVYGDTAILTYNFAGVWKDKDGKTHPNYAKSTRVYAKMGKNWKLVHANFAPVIMGEDD